MDTRFWTTTEISALSVGACYFFSPEKKMWRQKSEVKLVIIVAYDRNDVIATDCFRGITVTAACYTKFLQVVLRPQICQKSSAMFAAGILILHDNAGPHSSGAVLEILEMYGKCFPSRRTKLTWDQQPLTCSQNWRNHSVGNASEGLRRCLMRWPE